MQGVATKLVYHVAEQHLAVCAATAKNEGIVARRAEDVGRGAVLTDVLDAVERTVAVEQLDAVVAIPVASHYDPSAVKFYTTGQCALCVEAAEATEGVGRRVIELNGEAAPHAKRLAVASAQQHLP